MCVERGTFVQEEVHDSESSAGKAGEKRKKGDGEDKVDKEEGVCECVVCFEEKEDAEFVNALKCKHCVERRICSSCLLRSMKLKAWYLRDALDLDEEMQSIMQFELCNAMVCLKCPLCNDNSMVFDKSLVAKQSLDKSKLTEWQFLHYAVSLEPHSKWETTSLCFFGTGQLFNWVFECQGPDHLAITITSHEGSCQWCSECTLGACEHTIVYIR